MSETTKQSESQSFGERVSRFFRNINAIGAVAFAGIGVLLPPPLSAVSLSYAGLNAGQAAFFEVTRQASASNRKKQNKNQ